MTEKELRELDAWIAEHVMGLTRAESPLHIVGGTFAVHQSEGKVYIHVGRNNIAPFCPTTDPAASMQVMEKCAEELYEKGANLELGKSYDDENQKTEWFVAHDRTILSHYAATLPLAICLFAKQLFTK